jgi:uncharacterized delta-60 repeat protein
MIGAGNRRHIREAAVFIEGLESRQLMAGGVDSTFAGPSGFRLNLPQWDETIRDSTIDDRGRTILVGSVTPPGAAESQRQMLVVRLTPNGTLDSSFGNGGVITATPRAQTSAQNVAVLSDGSYVIAGESRILKFRADGTIDTRFGGGRGWIGITPQVGNGVDRFMPLPDGGFWLIGWGRDRRELDNYYSAWRLRSDGSAAVNSTPLEWARHDYESGTLLVRAAKVTTTGGLELVSYRGSWNDIGTYESSRLTLVRIDPTQLVERRDTLYEGLSGEGTPSNMSPSRSFGNGVFVEPNGQRRLVIASAGDMLRFNLDQPGRPEVLPQIPGFGPAYGGVLAGLKDGSVLVGGSADRFGSASAYVTLTPNFRINSTFGTQGILRLPNSDPRTSEQSTSLQVAPDGSILANVSMREGQTPLGNRFIRLFRDDRPIASLVSQRSDVNQHRFTVQFRATRPVNPLSLGDDDLRLVLGTSRYGLRVLSYSVENGRVTASYAIANSAIPAGTFQLRSIDNAVTSTAGQGLIGRGIASVVLA